MHQSKRIFILILFTFFFMGCGGGSSSDSDSTQQFSEGIWEGTYTTDTGLTFSSLSIVTSSGEVGINMGNGVFFMGTCNVSGNNISISGGESVETLPIVKINGNVSSSKSMNLTVTQGGYAMSKGDKLEYSYNDSYDQASSLSLLNGSWSGTNTIGGSPLSTTLNIDSNGDITGSHGVFTFSGTFSLIDASVNEYEVDLSIIGAPQYSAVGDYFGSAAIVDTIISNETLVIFIEKQSTDTKRYCLSFSKN